VKIGGIDKNIKMLPRARGTMKEIGNIVQKSLIILHSIKAEKVWKYTIFLEAIKD
jgi:hypothetical protein